MSPGWEIRMVWARIVSKVERNGKPLDIFNKTRLSMRMEMSQVILRLPAQYEQ